MKKCKLCGNEVSGKQKSFCCGEHREKYHRDHYYRGERYRLLREGKLGERYNTCAICGWKAKSLMTHLSKVHEISKPDYCKTYDKTDDDVVLKEIRQMWGDKLKGKDNPAFNHGGKYSPYSKNFVKYEGLSDDDVEKQIKKLQKKMAKSLKTNDNMSSQAGYWMKQGLSEDDAKRKVIERQRTFTLEKCIEKYGGEEGKKRWKDRQKKWQDNLKSKSPEEKERINRAKMAFNGYSKISQVLFKSIYKKVANDFTGIFFATLKNGRIDNTGKNNEYMLQIDGQYFFLDFLVEDSNKIIEFDGDYWHGDARGNQERDRIRDNKILSAGYDLLHITEREYKNDPKLVEEKCINFIYG